MADLEPQQHGGALRRWAPGDPGARQAARHGTSLRAARKAGLALLASGTEEASRVLLDALLSDDERVRTIAAVQILDRVLGRPRENESVDSDEPPTTLDMTHFTPEQRADAMEAIRKLHHYIALSRELAPQDGEV